MNKVKQGQTKWLPIVYEPGKIQGYENEYLGVVYQCFVTKVTNKTIHYQCGNGFYMCGKEYWENNLYKTFRKARKDVLQKLNLI